MTFQSLLDLFPDPEQQPSAAQLASLSHLDREDVALLAEAWEDVDAERKRHMLVQMAEMAEDNVDLNFDAAFKLGLQDETSVMRTDIDVRSIGIATKLLQKKLNTALAIKADKEGPTHVAGLYEAYCPYTASSIAGIAIVHGAVSFRAEARSAEARAHNYYRYDASF